MQRLILNAIGVAVRVYYRHERIGGDVPVEGPVVIVANHPNGLVDPVVLSWTTARELRFLGKAPLFKLPVLGFFVRRMRTIPVYRAQDGADTADNERTFAAVFDALAAGDAVCLFPEGRSHDEPELQRLKTGAARMALGAEARSGFGLGVRVVPVGLVYRAKHRFRSPVATWIGEPIDARDLATRHGEDAWAAVEELTERIEHGLKQVTLELDQWTDLPLVDLAERIEAGDAPDGPPGARLPRLHAFAESLRILRSRDPKRMESLTLRVAGFRKRLRSLGVDVRDLDLRYSFASVSGFILRNLIWLLVGFPLAALGHALFAVPYWLARLVGDRISTSRDIYATVHILAGIAFHVLWSGVLLAVVWFALGWSWAMLIATLMLPAGIAALAFHDWRGRVLADVGTFFRLGTRERLKRSLREERDQLARELDQLRQELATSHDRGSRGRVV